MHNKLLKHELHFNEECAKEAVAHMIQMNKDIREVAAIVHVVRCFDDENIIHVEGKTDPIRDIEIINVELILADLEIIENRINKLGA